MAVPASERNESMTQFLETAADIADLCCRISTRMPSRWKDNRTRWLLERSQALVDECAAANAIWVHDALDSEMRLRHLIDAKATCYVVQMIATRLVAARPTHKRYLRDKEGRKVMGDDGEPVLLGEKESAVGLLIDLSRQVNREHALLTGVIDFERSRLSQMRDGG